MPELESTEKRRVVEEMLAKGDTMICLDSGYPEVRVPEGYKDKEDLRLVLNLNFRHSITTLPDGIQAELLFGGVPFLCWIPYDSLWAVYNPDTGEGYLWPGQTPVSLLDLLGGKQGAMPSKKDAAHEGPAKASSPRGKTGPSGAGERDKKERPRFRVIQGGKKD